MQNGCLLSIVKVLVLKATKISMQLSTVQGTAETNIWRGFAIAFMLHKDHMATLQTSLVDSTPSTLPQEETREFLKYASDFEADESNAVDSMIDMMDDCISDSAAVEMREDEHERFKSLLVAFESYVPDNTQEQNSYDYIKMYLDSRK